MLDIFFEVVFSLILMHPGALIRWVFYRGNKSYEELIDVREANTNTFVSIVFICLIIIIINLL